ncbi:MAG: MogA/MoaB family molybdenum cofactor biosynthesis protein [Acidimicrobiia bacterium]
MSDLRAGVVTVSDSVAAGTADDLSGPAVVGRLERIGFRLVDATVVPDGVESVEAELRRMSGCVDLIVTTGGTGLGPRDLTPEGTAEVIDRPVPGIPEALRAATFGRVPFGMLSRGVAGVAGSCLIVNLPGSTKAVEEGFDVLADVLVHAVEVASGNFGRHD